MTDRLSELRAFASAWEGSDTVAEVAAATGMNSREASNLAAYFRRRGVPLKRMENIGNLGAHLVRLTPDEWQAIKLFVEHEAKAREMKRRYREGKT